VQDAHTSLKSNEFVFMPTNIGAHISGTRSLGN